MPGSVRVGLPHVVRELRGGFVLRPGAITIALAALAIGLATLEERITPVRAWSEFLDRIFPPEPEAAHVVLGTIAGSMITVVSVVYSILLVVLTFASTQFSPRVLVAFVEDRVSQTTLGVFVGTFTYCLLTLPAVRSQPEPFVPSIAVVVAIGLAIACLACLLYFIHHMAARIQASHVVDRIAGETERVLDELFPRPLDVPPAPAEDVPDGIGRGVTVLATRSGYIRSVDESSLLAAARAADVAVRVDRAVGHFVIEGMPLFEASPADRATDALRAAALRAFDIGPARTMEQDVEFGVLQIVDIALKAISPAVNDPTTALTCIDQLGRILVRAAMREPPTSTLRDPDGRARVALPRTSFPRLLDVAFSQIGHYGKADVAVPLRMMRVLAELAGATRHGPYALAIRDQARRLSDACAQGFPDADRDELNERLAAVEQVVEAITRGGASRHFLGETSCILHGPGCKPQRPDPLSSRRASGVRTANPWRTATCRASSRSVRPLQAPSRRRARDDARLTTRRMEVDRRAFGGHLVICHWAPRGLQLIREVHSRLAKARRPIVIIDEHAGSIALPGVKGEGAFDDVYIVRGEPTNEVILRRAGVPDAYSVIILADDREGRHADGKSVVTCIAVRDVCRAAPRPNVVVECHNPDFCPHLLKAGADEVVSADEMGLRLVARAALFHGMTRLYQELLTVGRDANEMFVVTAPAALVGRDFVEVNALFARHRDGDRSCLLIGIERDGQMHLNPTGAEAGPLQPGDELIVLSRAAPDPSLPLPTEPPIDPTPAIGRGAAREVEASR